MSVDHDTTAAQNPLVAHDYSKPPKRFVRPNGDVYWGCKVYDSDEHADICTALMLHRLDGPAYFIGNSWWWYHFGKQHREDGPAVESAGGIAQFYYFINKRYQNMQQWAKAILKHRCEPYDEDAITEFIRNIFRKRISDLI